MHWFMIPLTVCGALTCTDVVAWARGRLSALEPRALVGLFGVHFFYAAPVLHVMWDYWPAFVPPAQDWRNALGIVACINALGLMVYRLVLAIPYRRDRGPRLVLDLKRLGTALHGAIAMSMIAFVMILIRFGGPVGYLGLITDRGERAALDGTGWLLIVGEAWPFLLFVALAVRHREYLRDHLPVLVILLFGFALVQFGVSGLRGSRANTVWPLLIALGILHVVVRPVRRLAISLGVLVMVLFAWIYGLYKAVGVEVVGVVKGATNVAQLTEESGRSIDVVLLGDFGRSSVQALVADRLGREGTTSQLAWGESYLGDLLLLVPSFLEGSDPPRDKIAIGTDLLYGAGTYAAGFESSRIYGMVGEAMMNFGFVGGVAIFGLFGLIVRWVTRLYRSGERELCASSLIAPALAAMCVLFLVSDIDNVIWFAAKHVLPLGAVVAVSLTRPPVPGKRKTSRR
jgi:hypothetical protein